MTCTVHSATGGPAGRIAEALVRFLSRLLTQPLKSEKTLSAGPKRRYNGRVASGRVKPEPNRSMRTKRSAVAPPEQVAAERTTTIHSAVAPLNNQWRDIKAKFSIYTITSMHPRTMKLEIVFIIALRRTPWLQLEPFLLVPLKRRANLNTLQNQTDSPCNIYFLHILFEARTQTPAPLPWCSFDLYTQHQQMGKLHLCAYF